MATVDRRVRRASTSAAITREFARSPSLYLTVIGSLLAFTVYGWMLRVAPLPLVATYAYVNPVVAVILGAIVLGEPIDAADASSPAAVIDRRGRADRDRAWPDASAGRRRGRARTIGVARPGVAAVPAGEPATTPLDARDAQAVGRSQPWAGHGSQRSGRSSR